MPDEGNGNGNDGNNAASEVQQQLTDAQAKLATAEGENKSLKDAKGDLEHKLDEADKELLSEDYLNFKDGNAKEGKGGAAASDGDGEGTRDSLDLERASNREVVEFINKKYKGDIQVAVKDITSRLDKGDERIALTFAQIDVTLTALRHGGGDGKPSFNDNEKAIYAIAKTNPKWGAEKCYQQFLLESKASEDEKKAAAIKKADEDQKALTEKRGVPGSTVQDKQLSPEEAAEAGYKEAFGNKE